MATYESPIDSQTDPDAPITSQLGKRWDNNPIAIAEGASGAPRVSPKATGYTVLSGGAVGTVVLTDISSYDGADIEVKYRNSAPAGAPMVLDLSDDGVTYGSTVTIGTVGANGVGSASLTLDTTTGAVVSAFSDTVSAGLLTGSAGIPGTPISHIRITASGASTTTVAAVAKVNAGVVA